MGCGATLGGAAHQALSITTGPAGAAPMGRTTAACFALDLALPPALPYPPLLLAPATFHPAVEGGPTILGAADSFNLFICSTWYSAAATALLASSTDFRNLACSAGEGNMYLPFSHFVRVTDNVASSVSFLASTCCDFWMCDPSGTTVALFTTSRILVNPAAFFSMPSFFASAIFPLRKATANSFSTDVYCESVLCSHAVNASRNFFNAP
mmetsp:Transcript_42494/g.92744  ORF Transcript_42494/g.92744 Transcript_42494/m.92744 type:complete len:210 (+) Transcript_42494:658-1287(+)